MASKSLNRGSALLCVCLLGAAHTVVLAVFGFADTGTGALLRGILGFCAGAFLCTASIRPMRLAPAIAIAVVFDLFEYAAPAIFLLIAGLGANKRGPLIEAMSSRPMVWLGKISYSIYLIHFPLLIGADRFLQKFDYLQSRSGQAAFCLCYIAVVLTLAHLSWRFFETPARVAIYRWYRGARP